MLLKLSESSPIYMFIVFLKEMTELNLFSLENNETPQKPKCFKRKKMPCSNIEDPDIDSDFSFYN